MPLFSFLCSSFWLYTSVNSWPYFPLFSHPRMFLHDPALTRRSIIFRFLFPVCEWMCVCVCVDRMHNVRRWTMGRHGGSISNSHQWHPLLVFPQVSFRLGRAWPSSLSNGLSVVDSFSFFFRRWFCFVIYLFFLSRNHWWVSQSSNFKRKKAKNLHHPLQASSKFLFTFSFSGLFHSLVGPKQLL